VYSELVKLYADDRAAMLRRLALDLVVLAWTGLGIWLGFFVHDQLLKLRAIGTAIADTGRTLNGWISDFSSAIPGQGAPIIGNALSDYVDRLTSSLRASSGDLLVSRGNQLNELIGSLALYVGIIAGAVVVLAVLVPYTLRRVAGAREMGAGRAFVESARAGGRVREAQALLAFRALATLPFTRIMRVSSDPVGDLADGEHAALAGAMLARMGLEPGRLYGPGGSGGLPEGGASRPRLPEGPPTSSGPPADAGSGPAPTARR
jgi:hypothetical protein